MIFSILPSFLKDKAYASHMQIGWLEGGAVFCSFFAKIIVGWISDFKIKRIHLILFGAILTIFSKLSFVCVASIYSVFFARGFDRLVKGVRSAPLDAFISDYARDTPGIWYGTKQTFNMLGGVFGGGVSAFILYITQNNYHLVFKLSSIPAILAFCIAFFFLKDEQKMSSKKFCVQDVHLFPKAYWITLVGIFFFMCARFSVTFLNIRLKDVGYDPSSIALIIAIYEFIYALTAFPAGYLSDKYNRFILILTGISILIIANLAILIVPGKTGIVLGVVLAAIHVGITQGVMSAIISSFAPEKLRGTSFSIYYLFEGVAVFLGNIIAGYLSFTLNNSKGAFFGGIFFAVISLMWFLYVLPWKKKLYIQYENDQKKIYK